MLSRIHVTGDPRSDPRARLHRCSRATCTDSRLCRRPVWAGTLLAKAAPPVVRTAHGGHWRLFWWLFLLVYFNHEAAYVSYGAITHCVNTKSFGCWVTHDYMSMGTGCTAVHKSGDQRLIESMFMLCQYAPDPAHADSQRDSAWPHGEQACFMLVRTEDMVQYH